MIELTAQDYAAILAAIEPYKFDSGSQINEMLDACYRAGLAAGIARSAKVCDDLRWDYNGHPLASDEVSAEECADAIRALLKEQR